jgi:hypothetical protein
MSPRLIKQYFDVRRSPIGKCVSPSVPYCFQAALTLIKWDAAERAGFVRLRYEWDQDFDPAEYPDCDFGEDPEAFGSIGEYRLDTDSDEWVHADSVWGHVGYLDVIDWRENPYVIDIMRETLDQFNTARKQTVLASPTPAY